MVGRRSIGFKRDGSVFLEFGCVVVQKLPHVENYNTYDVVRLA
jgi:hypothetical protein